MTERARKAMGLHTLAHDIATGERVTTGIRWYIPAARTRLTPTPVLPESVHTALCPSDAVNLFDEEQRVWVCDECKVAVEDAA